MVAVATGVSSAPPAPDDTVYLGFLLVPSFSMLAFTSAIEPLRLANRSSRRTLFRWIVMSKDGEPVRASNGLAVIPDAPMTRFSHGPSGVADPEGELLDMAFVCSGLGVERFNDPTVNNWLRRVERQGSKIGALCTGAHVLAKAGLLRGYKCAIHWESLPGFTETFPDIEVSGDLFEVDRSRYTCSGGTAALDMMLNVISESHGPKLATQVSEQCLVDRIRDPHDRQRLPLRARLGIHNSKLIGAIEQMESHISEPLSQDAIALSVGLSRRQLERLFRKNLGRSPAQYYLEMRLERARHLLYQSDMPIVDLAYATGFVSPSHFSKCYRDLYGKSPREERLQAET